jgi:hypothetical protein
MALEGDRDMHKDPNKIPLDHFFQLVLMHEETFRAWLKVHGGELPEDRQARLSRSRSELLDRLSEHKRLKK